jgi:hypothetical protein
MADSRDLATFVRPEFVLRHQVVLRYFAIGCEAGLLRVRCGSSSAAIAPLTGEQRDVAVPVLRCKKWYVWGA